MQNTFFERFSRLCFKCCTAFPCPHKSGSGIARGNLPGAKRGNPNCNERTQKITQLHNCTQNSAHRTEQRPLSVNRCKTKAQKPQCPVQLDRTQIVMEEHALQIDKKGQMRLVKQSCLFSPHGLGWVGGTTGNGSKVVAS